MERLVDIEDGALWLSDLTVAQRPNNLSYDFA